MVRKCLQECTRLRAKSISIPSIGAGNLGYPGNVVAGCLLEETLNYLSNNEGKTTIQLVHFVIFDGTVHQAFQSEYSDMASGKKSTDSNASKGASLPQPSGTDSSRTYASRKKPSRNSKAAHHTSSDDCCNFALPNGIALQLAQGDITDEQSDVVVNTTNPELRLAGGGVAGALLRKGGNDLQEACDALRRQGIKAAEGKVVETRCEGMGELNCKSIFHIVFEGKDQRKLVKTILACLDRAEKMKYTSIALPAIGTGTVAYPTSLAAEGIVKALKQFAQKRPNHVRLIRMVIFLPQMFQQFTEAFKKIGENDSILNYIYDKGAKFLHSVGSAILNPFNEEESSDEERMESLAGSYDHVRLDSDEDMNDEKHVMDILSDIPLNSEVTICVYGASSQSVKQAEKRLRAIIDTTFITEDIDNPHITELPSSAINTLQTFAKDHSVDIHIDSDPAIHSIKLHGCQSDVLKVKDKVRDILAEMHQSKTKVEAATAVHKHVKWVRQLSDGPDDYDELLSYEIEQAFQQKNGSYCHDGEGEHFTIDFSKMEEKDLDSGDCVHVLRIDYSKGLFIMHGLMYKLIFYYQRKNQLIGLQCLRIPMVERQLFILSR